MFYYCFGGGFGHLTRYLAFCHTFSIAPHIITVSSSLLARIRLPEKAKVFVPDETEIENRESLTAWLNNLLKAHRAEKLFIDAFPAGILGELCSIDLSGIELVYLARTLQWEKYLKRVNGKLPLFKKVLILEKLPPEQWRYLKNLNCPMETISLVDPPAHPQVDLPKDCWLIVHSDSNAELHQLLDYAQKTAELEKLNPAFVVVAPGPRPCFLRENDIHLDIYPAHHLFSSAARVFSGAGFNICRQMLPYSDKHYPLPFARSLDDQFFRIKKSPQPFPDD